MEPPFRKHKSGRKKYHPRYHIRPHYLQICLFVLAPAYILFTSVLLLYPSFHHPRHRYHRPREQVKKVQGSSTRNTKLRQLAGVEPRMSTMRVVFMSSDKIFYTNLNKNRGRIKGAEESVSQSNDYSNKKQTLPHMGNRHTTTSKPNNNHKADCIPMAAWQTLSFPTCNSLHELNIFASSPTMSYFRPHRQRNDHRFPGEKISGHGIPISESSVRLLGNGWFRNAWEVDTFNGINVAAKTLR